MFANGEVASVLVVDDDERLLTLVARMLGGEDYDVSLALSGDDALAQLATKPYDAVLMDVHMPGRTGLETLRAMRERGHMQPVVIMSGAGTIDLAVRAVREGALDFVEKPLRHERVVLTMANAVRFARMENRAAALEDDVAQLRELVGSSTPMARLRALIAKAAPSEGRVLITGENGTGKELVARAIHAGSPRASFAFIRVNSAALPAELVESELFGHEKGAFTGAVAARAGRFERAHRGTLFLDEVGDMPANMQAKLLRVLQEGEVERVGASQPRVVDVRVIAATNRDLGAMVATGEFREDLYYRLNVVAIPVPPLRERKDDIPELAIRFCRQAAIANNRSSVRLEDSALLALSRHDYPGNVRELQNVVERLVILTDTDVIDGCAVESTLGLPGRARSVPSLYEEGRTLKEMMLDAERTILDEALRRHRGNVTDAAGALGLERSHLHKKLKALKVTRHTGDQRS